MINLGKDSADTPLPYGLIFDAESLGDRSHSHHHVRVSGSEAARHVSQIRDSMRHQGETWGYSRKPKGAEPMANVLIYHPDLPPLEGSEAKRRELVVAESAAVHLCADPPKGGGWRRASAEKKEKS